MCRVFVNVEPYQQLGPKGAFGMRPSTFPKSWTSLLSSAQVPSLYEKIAQLQADLEEVANVPVPLTSERFSKLYLSRLVWGGVCVLVAL